MAQDWSGSREAFTCSDGFVNVYDHLLRASDGAGCGMAEEDLLSFLETHNVGRPLESLTYEIRRVLLTSKESSKSLDQYSVEVGGMGKTCSTMHPLSESGYGYVETALQQIVGKHRTVILLAVPILNMYLFRSHTPTQAPVAAQHASTCNICSSSSVSVPAMNASTPMLHAHGALVSGWCLLLIYP